MENVTPLRSEGQAYEYTWDDDGNVQRVEPLDRINEESEPPSASATRSAASKPPTISWPFHRRRQSEGGRSSTLSSHFRRERSGTGYTGQTGHSRRPSAGAASTLSSHLRKANWKPRSFSMLNSDDGASISLSIVPDYIVHFMRGETPETLRRKKEAQSWGRHDVDLVDRRTMVSTPVEVIEGYNSTECLHAYGTPSQRSTLGRHFTGWRGGVVSNAMVAIVILLTTLVCLIIGLTKSDVASGESQVYTGSCDRAKTLNIGLHVLVNVFSVVLLSGASYVFQVLSSPTRSEVDAAHSNKWWLDFGIPSIRNFLYISGFRATLATVLILCAVALTVIYNAIIYTTQLTADTCSLTLSNMLLGIACLLNLIILICMVVILTRSTFTPLATVGDAIRSFLQKPDPTTIESGLLTKSDMKAGKWGAQEPKQYKPRTHFWLQTPSKSRWTLTLFSWALVVGPVAAALSQMIGKLQASGNGNISSLFPAFGTATPETTFSLVSSPSKSTISTTQTAILASLPQFLLGILYLSSNALLTSYFLSHELSLFASSPTPRFLRVSSHPSGAQSTSLYLTLPRPVSWLLLAIFIGMGVCMSQAVIPVLPAESATSFKAEIGFNTTALAPLLGLLTVLILLIFLLGLRRAPPACDNARLWDLENGRLTPGTLHTQNTVEKGVPQAVKRKNPLVMAGGPCTAVLSAKCHISAAEPDDFWIHGPVTWGVVARGNPGHCAFSAMPAVQCLEEGEMYC